MNARKSIVVGSSQFIITILGWIGLIILAKFWGSYAPEALGMIGYALAFVGLFGALADVGFSQAHIKRVSEGKDLGTCIGTFITIKIVLIVLMVSVVLFSMFILRNFFGVAFSDTTDLIIYIFILYYVFGYLVHIPISTFQGRGEMVKMQLATISESLVRVSFRMVVLFAGVVIAGNIIVKAPIEWAPFLQPLQELISQHAVDCIAFTYVLGGVATFIVGIWLMRKYPISKPTRDMLKSYLVFAIPISLVSVSMVVTKSVDKIMIGYFWTSVEVGYYFTVQQISQVIVVLSGSLAIVLFPSLSGYHSNGDYSVIKSLVHNSIRYISMFVVPIIVLICLFSKEIIIILLDSAFLPGSSTLVILSLFALVSALMIPYICLITGVDKPKIVAKIGILMCVSNVVLNLLFIPVTGVLSTFGIYAMTGAAVASLCSVVIGFVYTVYKANKLVKIGMINKHVLLHIISGTLSGIFILFLMNFVTTMYWYHIVIASVICILVYFGILIQINEFTKKDYRFFLDTINLGKMKEYIKGEMNDN